MPNLKHGVNFYKPMLRPDGTWRIFHHYKGLNAITETQVEPLLHIDALLDENALLDETRCAK